MLFMVPADSDDIRKEYEILLNELRTFNPEMLDKQRVLAVTKCDMLDQELMDEIEPKGFRIYSSLLSPAWASLR